jgi:tellurite resistance protein TerB
MELTDLTHDEQLALVTLIETVVASDREVSDDEAEQIERVASALGPETYRALAEEADARFRDEAGLKGFLAGIQRQEARELIYGTVLEAALPDVIDQHESSLLGWLASAWSVTVQFEA